MTDNQTSPTLVGVFARREDAERAIDALRAAGFPDDRVTFDEDAELDVPEGAGDGGEGAVAVVVQTDGRDAEVREVLSQAGAADVYDPNRAYADAASDQEEVVEEDIIEHLPPPVGELAPAAPPAMPPVRDDAPAEGSEESAA